MNGTDPKRNGRGEEAGPPGSGREHPPPDRLRATLMVAVFSGAHPFRSLEQQTGNRRDQRFWP